MMSRYVLLSCSVILLVCVVYVKSDAAEKGEPGDHPVYKTGGGAGHHRFVNTGPPDDIQKKISDKLDAIVKKKKDAGGSDIQKCTFNHADMAGLEEFVAIPAAAASAQKCLWSGIKPKCATGYVDNDKGCMRVENTALGWYLGTKYPKKTTSYPSTWLPCHNADNWDYDPEPNNKNKHTTYPGKWEGGKIVGMPFFKALWHYASYTFAKDFGQKRLDLFVNAIGNSRSGNNVTGDVYTQVESPQLVEAAKTAPFTNVNMYIIDDFTVDPRTDPTISCANHLVVNFLAKLKADLKAKDIKCIDVNLTKDDKAAKKYHVAEKPQ